MSMSQVSDGPYVTMARRAYVEHKEQRQGGVVLLVSHRYSLCETGDFGISNIYKTKITMACVRLIP